MLAAAVLLAWSCVKPQTAPTKPAAVPAVAAAPAGGGAAVGGAGGDGTTFQNPRAGTSGLRIVTVNPASGQIEETLPFDEPFLVQTARPKDARELSIRMLEVRTIGGSAFQCDTTENWEPSRWSSQGTWLASEADKSATNVLIGMGPLSADRYIQACLFTKSAVPADKQPAVKAAVRNALASSVTHLDPYREGFTADGLKVIQRSILESLNQIGGLRFEPVRYSALDTNWTAAGANSPARAQVVATAMKIAPLVQTRANQLDAAENVVASAMRAGAALNTLKSATDAAVNQIPSSVDASLLPAHAALIGRIQSAATNGRFLAGGFDRVDANLARGVAARAQSAEDLKPVLQEDTLLALRLDTLSMRLQTYTASPQRAAALAATRDAIASVASSTQAMAQVQAELKRRELVLDNVTDDATPVVESSVYLVGSSVADLVSRGRSRIGLDVGVASTPRIGKAAPYAGLNFYFRPVNTSVPLGLNGGLWQRFSLGFGMTTSSLQNAQRTDILGSTSILLSAGLRVWDAFRLSGGIVPYRLNEGDPLTKHSVARFEGFVGASVDNDIKSALGGIYNTLFNNKQ